MIETVLVVVHLLLAIGMVGLILLQHGKGADAGAAFGSGASATVFGARGSANFLSRTTGILAAIFFATSIALASFALDAGREAGLMDSVMSEQAASTADTASDLPAVNEDEATAAAPAGDLPVVSEDNSAPSDVPVAPAQ